MVVKFLTIVILVSCCITDTKALCTTCTAVPEFTGMEILLRRLRFRLDRATRETMFMMNEELRRITSDFMVRNLDDINILETTSRLSTNITEIFESDYRNLQRLEAYWSDMAPNEIDGNEVENIADAQREICRALTSLCQCMQRQVSYPVEPGQLYTVRIGFTHNHSIYEHYIIARDTTRYLDILFNRYSEIENNYSLMVLI